MKRIRRLCWTTTPAATDTTCTTNVTAKEEIAEIAVTIIIALQIDHEIIRGIVVTIAEVIETVRGREKETETVTDEITGMTTDTSGTLGHQDPLPCKLEDRAIEMLLTEIGRVRGIGTNEETTTTTTITAVKRRVVSNRSSKDVDNFHLLPLSLYRNIKQQSFI